jgi:glycosyltransferase involved in cell wall biosynthesis
MLKQKKVLYVHHGSGLGGAPISLSFLLDCIDESKIKAELLCIFRGPVLKVFEDKKAEMIIEDKIFPFHGSTVSGMSLKLFLMNICRLPKSIYYAFKTVKRLKPDIVHLNSSSLFAVALATKMVNKEIKVICHIREPLLKNSISGFIIKNMNYLLVDQFVAIDQFSASSMKVKNNIEVVYNAVDFSRYNINAKSNSLRVDLGLNSTDIVFLYLARISKSNGAIELLDIVEKITAEHANFHFVIAGFREDGAEKSYVKKVEDRMATLKNVHKLRFVSDVPSLIADVDIMLAPFTEPHFARSVIEASSMGVPSIGSNLGGVNELIIHGKTGYLYDSMQDFYDYCVELGTNDGLRLKMGSEAEAFARSQFDHKINAQRIFDLYM